MPSLDTLLVFSLTTYLLVATPGPALIYIIGRTLNSGRSAGIASMIGAQAGEVVYLVGAALGVSTLIASSPTLLEVFRYAGAAYLIFLGVRQILRRNEATEAPRPPSVRGLAAQGFVLQILNPKLIVFFVAYFPLFLDPSEPFAPQMLVLGVVYMAIAIASDLIYVLGASVVAKRFLASPRAVRRTTVGTGVVYIGLGLAAAVAGNVAGGQERT